MEKTELYQKYVNILKEELVPAMGCTEPIAISYAAAKAREVLGTRPEGGRLGVSGSIVKNAKSVTVPHTGGLRGLRAAFSAGILFGDASRELEVLSGIGEEDYPAVALYVKEFPLTVEVPEDSRVFDIRVNLWGGGHSAFVRIANGHTDIVRVERDGETLFSVYEGEEHREDRSVLNVEDIVAFADAVDLSEVRETLVRQIEYNMAICEEGLKNNYGANVGKVILRAYQPDVKLTAKAYAAAGSDARMNGCEMPVIINSGSGNQGITASVPVVVYARALNLTEDKLLRALCISNLVTVHLKSGIGKLSAYCGAVSAGAGAACGVAYLLGGGAKEISHTLINTVAIDSGIICDGAKASCAAKIATAVESGMLGLQMYYQGNEFYAGDGIVKAGVEDTIRSVSRLAQEGMRETNKEIIRIMLEA